jgi:hypothetical protein
VNDKSSNKCFLYPGAESGRCDAFVLLSLCGWERTGLSLSVWASALRNSGCFNCFSRPRGRVEIRHSLHCRHEDESSETDACQAPALFSMLKSFFYNAPGSLLL